MSPYTRFEQVFFSYFDQMKRLIDASPLLLGAVSGAGGGFGGRPGGFVGVLPQTRVAFDSDEAEIWEIPESGSLLDNLNRIRYRLGHVEDGGSLSIYEDGILAYSGINILDFLTDHIELTSPGHVTISGDLITFLDLSDTPNTYTGESNKYVTVKGDETGLDFTTVVQSGDSFKVKVSSNDTTEDYLEDKIVAGAGILITTLNEGSNEDVEVSNSFEIKVSSDDTTENSLENKILGGSGITVTTISGAGNEHLEIIASGIPWGNVTNKPYRVMTFGYQGTLSVKTLEARLHAPFAGIIANITATVNTAPTGSSIILDVLKNDSTIFTTPANRPTITAGNQDDLSSVPDITSISLNDIFTVEIDQIGSSIAGSDLVLQIRCEV